jgi:hypothetical protein
VEQERHQQRLHGVAADRKVEGQRERVAGGDGKTSV